MTPLTFSRIWARGGAWTTERSVCGPAPYLWAILTPISFGHFSDTQLQSSSSTKRRIFVTFTCIQIIKCFYVQSMLVRIHSCFCPFSQRYLRLCCWFGDKFVCRYSNWRLSYTDHKWYSWSRLCWRIQPTTPMGSFFNWQVGNWW